MFDNVLLFRPVGCIVSPKLFTSKDIYVLQKIKEVSFDR